MEEVQEKPQDARAIANYILDKAPEYGISDLSIMKLMKLIFLAHGWAFYFRDIPLIKQQPEAWPYGPVYPQVYREYSGRGSLPVKNPIINKETGLRFVGNLTEGQKKAIDVVLEKYGKFSAFRLSSITHLDGSPWSRTFEENDGARGIISEEKMKTYYTNMAEQMGLPSD